MKCFVSVQVDGELVYCVKSVNQTCRYNLIIISAVFAIQLLTKLNTLTMLLHTFQCLQL